jgi:hypothetical protein
LIKNKPDLWKNMNRVVNFMEDGDYSKNFESIDEKVKQGKAGVELDREIQRL